MNSPANGGMTKSECRMPKDTTITKLQSVRRRGAIRGYSGLFKVKISVPGGAECRKPHSESIREQVKPEFQAPSGIGMAPRRTTPRFFEN